MPNTLVTRSSSRRASRYSRQVLRAMRALSVVALGAALCTHASRSSASDDAQTAAADLAHASDFRVRVSAALQLGRQHPEGARIMLERALDDAHPAVRTAAAAALAALGDAQAIGALERHARSEGSASVRAQMRTSMDVLRAKTGGVAKARYAVVLGTMRNGTGVRGGELTQVLATAARAHASTIPGAVVVDASDAGQRRALAGVPVLQLDGQLVRLAQSTASGSVRVEAQVEFSVRRVPEQTLKGMLSGSATSMGSMRPVTPAGVIDLQNQAVGGAVESALRGADRGLASAAR